MAPWTLSREDEMKAVAVQERPLAPWAMVALVLRAVAALARVVTVQQAPTVQGGAVEADGQRLVVEVAEARVGLGVDVEVGAGGDADGGVDDAGAVGADVVGAGAVGAVDVAGVVDVAGSVGPEPEVEGVVVAFELVVDAVLCYTPSCAVSVIATGGDQRLNFV